MLQLPLGQTPLLLCGQLYPFYTPCVPPEETIFSEKVNNSRGILGSFRGITRVTHTILLDKMVFLLGFKMLWKNKMLWKFGKEKKSHTNAYF